MPKVKYSLKPPPTRPSAKYHCVFTGTFPLGVGLGEGVKVGEGEGFTVGVEVGELFVIVKLSVKFPPEPETNFMEICPAETLKREIPQVWLLLADSHVLK